MESNAGTPQTSLPPVNSLPHDKPSNSLSATKKQLLIMAGVVVFVIIGIVAWQIRHHDSADSLFWAAMKHTLETKTVTQTITDSHGDKVTILYDVTDPRHAKLANKDSFSSLTIEGYSTMRDSFLKFSSTNPLISENPALKPVFNKWVQIRKGGKLPSTYAQVGGQDGDTEPRRTLFGEIIFGNFSASTVATMLEYMQHNKVYSFDKRYVTQSKGSDSGSLQFRVTQNHEALRNLNIKMAPLFGLTAQEVTDYFDKDDHPTNAIWEIDPKTKELIGVRVSVKGSSMVTTYSSYNSTKLRTAPKPDIQWNDYLKLTQTAESQLQNL